MRVWYQRFLSIIFGLGDGWGTLMALSRRLSRNSLDLVNVDAGVCWNQT